MYVLAYLDSSYFSVFLSTDFVLHSGMNYTNLNDHHATNTPSSVLNL